MEKIEQLKKLKNKLINFDDTLGIPTDVTFGLELEFENIYLKRIKEIILELQEEKKGFENYKDKLEISNLSLCDKEPLNGEISTCILTDCVNDWENLKELLMILKKEKAIITKKCGSHINIGAHILGNNEDFWRNFILLWKLYEDEIFMFSTGEYKKIRDYYYIKPIKDKLELDMLLSKNGDTLEYINNLKKFTFYGKESFNNSLSLNKTNSFIFEKGNVIEFRTPNGTLNIDIYKNYVNFFVKFLLACKQELDIEKIVYKIKNNEHDAIELSNLVYNDEIDKNNFLIQTYKTNHIYKKRLSEHIYCRKD